MTEIHETASISYVAAARIVASGLDIAAQSDVRAMVSVVDPAMALVAFGRADGATPHSVETSRRKANTSASTKRPTGWMQGDFAIQLPLATGGALTNIAGGVPISFNGRHVGGLGVAGGTPAQDAEIAIAVLDAIGADPVAS